ncbi:MAG: mechanosensitive ion channel family protein [Pseudomonadales bacterium]|jgi:MscS family membrane protein|nr:mechanosensitive ion channel family protein [Pseudomonadales bacterium]
MNYDSETLPLILDWFTNPLVVKVFVVILCTAIVSSVSRRAINKMKSLVESTDSLWDDALLGSVSQPLNLLIWILGVSLAAELIADNHNDLQIPLIASIRYLGFIALLAFFAVRVVSEIEKTYISKGSDETTVTAVAKLVRISLVITAGLMTLQTLGVSISGVLAFGGVGGIAVGFAAQDLLSNFFGGLVIYLDRPFKVGDWIRSPDREIEGTVIKIGWRLTEIRTFDQRPLYIPNSMFSTISLENPSRMSNRRIYETIGLRYADVDKVGAIVADVETMLRTHPDIDTQRTLMVNFNAFSASSLDFFVYTFTKTTNWVEFHAIKQEILMQIAGIISKHGAEIAFPTTTVHIEPGD